MDDRETVERIGKGVIHYLAIAACIMVALFGVFLIGVGVVSIVEDYRDTLSDTIGQLGLLTALFGLIPTSIGFSVAWILCTHDRQ